MPDTVDVAIRGLRIIVAGLVAGLLAFSAIMAVVGRVLRTTDPVIVKWTPVVLGVVAVACASQYFFLRRRLVRDLAGRAQQLRQDPDPAVAVVAAYQRFVIAGAGQIEGLGFLGIIAYGLTGSNVCVAVIALALAGLAMHFPSQAALRRLADAALSE